MVENLLAITPYTLAKNVAGCLTSIFLFIKKAWVGNTLAAIKGTDKRTDVWS